MIYTNLYFEVSNHFAIHISLYLRFCQNSLLVFCFQQFTNSIADDVHLLKWFTRQTNNVRIPSQQTHCKAERKIHGYIGWGAVKNNTLAKTLVHILYQHCGKRRILTLKVGELSRLARRRRRQIHCVQLFPDATGVLRVQRRPIGKANARLTAIWPIFTGLKIYSAYDAAKENVNAKKAAFDMAQNTILMDVATKYFTLRLAEELAVMRETTKKNLEEHLERSKKLEASRQISKAERLRAEVALAEAENAYDDALRDQSLARMALASLLHTDTNITAVTPVEAPESVRTMEEIKQKARENHPGLRQLRTERKRSQDAVSAARADYFPTVALFAYKELYTKDLTILEPEWAVGAKAQWDLFKGGETRSKVANAKAMDRSLASMEEQTLDNIGLLVEKRWRELEHAKGRLESLKKTRELADEALRSQKLAYESGLATGLDVVDAELALSRLQVADLKAHYDAVIAWLGLLEASGEVEQAGAMLNSKTVGKE